MLILELRPIHDAALWMAPMPVICDLPSPLFQGVAVSMAPGSLNPAPAENALKEEFGFK